MPSTRLSLYRAATTLASALPAQASCRLALAVGSLVGRLPDYDGKRAIVASHMGRVMGRPLAGREARSVVAAVFANYARYWAESFRLPSVPQAEVIAGVKTVGEDNLDNALGAGRGVIIAAPHLGGWEWGAMYLIARGLHVTVAVEPLEPPELFDWFAAYRERLGMQVVPVGPQAGAAILQALRQGHVVCLLSDRLVGPTSGVEVVFFGERVAMPAGPVTLALRSRAPLLCSAVYFGAGADDHTIDFRPPIELNQAGRFSDRVVGGTRLLASELELLVSAAPTQWHMVQPNWSDDPPLRSRTNRQPGGRGRSTRAGGGPAPAPSPAPAPKVGAEPEPDGDATGALR